MSFDQDIKNFNEKATRAATNIFRGTALGLFANIVKRTPVDTGRLRANWQSEINSPPTGTAKDTDKGGGKTIKDAKNKTFKAKLGDSIFLVNNLPYAKVIEDGSSTQAPAGMVKVTVAEFQAIVNKNAKAQK